MHQVVALSVVGHREQGLELAPLRGRHALQQLVPAQQQAHAVALRMRGKGCHGRFSGPVGLAEF